MDNENYFEKVGGSQLEEDKRVLEVVEDTYIDEEIEISEDNKEDEANETSENEGVTEEIRIYGENDSSFHSEGYNTMASGKGAHSEGSLTKAIGESAHSEGTSTRAIGFGAHAEGVGTYAGESGSHAEGIKTRAAKDSAHAEGNRTKAGGFASHAEGFKTISEGLASHAQGYGTSASPDGAFIMGKFGEATHPYSFHIANGINEEFKGVGVRLQGNGFGSLDLGLSVGNRGYSEMFEAADGEGIAPGYFVTLDGDKIRTANRRDEFILGVTSASSGIIGNSGEFRWKGKYEMDEWGRIHYRNILVPPVLNEEGYEIFPENYEMQPQLNPEWDSSQEYIPRLKRQSWVPVVLIGSVVVRDDGSCRVNGYCRVNNRGIAVSSSRGYRVLERIGENQILILFR